MDRQSGSEQWRVGVNEKEDEYNQADKRRDKEDEIDSKSHWIICTNKLSI